MHGQIMTLRRLTRRRLTPIVFLITMALSASAQTNEPAAAEPLPHVLGTAFHILPETHNHESGYFSLAEGNDGRLYVGTAKYGVNSYLVELDPGTGAQRVVIDTHKLCNSAGKGFTAQAKIHTRNFVAPSGRVYVGSKQGYPEKDESAWSYRGGFLMSYDPRTDSAESYGMVPYHGYGIIDVTADESRGLIYYVACEDNSRDHLWGVYDTRNKTHRLLGPRTCLYGSTLIDAKGQAYVMTHDYKLARYEPKSDRLTVRDVLVGGEPFDPVGDTIIHHRLTSWVMEPDGQWAYLLMLSDPTLYRIRLAGGSKTTIGHDLGEMLPSDRSTSSYSSLTLHPDGNVYALMVTPDPDGRTKRNLNVLVRYEPETKTMRTLGSLAIRNKDYFDFRPLPDGTPKPWSNGVETLPDGTLVPTAVHQGMVAGRDGTLYALLISPFAVLKIDDYRLPPVPPTPARKWTDFSLDICDRVTANMPTITAAAEAAAERYLAGGELDIYWPQGWPGQGPQSELTGRSGGLIDLGWLPVNPRPVDASRPSDERSNDVAIVGWQRAPQTNEAARIEAYRERGVTFVGFGPSGLPELAECEALCDYWIDTGFGTDDRAIVLPDGRRVGRANALANTLGGWTFMAEFVAALTRRGKMPPLYKAMLWKDTWDEWATLYRGTKRYHDDLFVPPLDPGVLGNRFLDQMRWHFRTFGNTQLDEVRKAAQLIVEEHAKGKKTVVTIAGHCMYSKVGMYEEGAWAE